MILKLRSKLNKLETRGAKSGFIPNLNKMQYT
jgi:hypothetical protein